MVAEGVLDDEALSSVVSKRVERVSAFETSGDTPASLEWRSVRTAVEVETLRAHRVSVSCLDGASRWLSLQRQGAGGVETPSLRGVGGDEVFGFRRVEGKELQEFARTVSTRSTELRTKEATFLANDHSLRKEEVDNRAIGWFSGRTSNSGVQDEARCTRVHSVGGNIDRLFEEVSWFLVRSVVDVCGTGSRAVL